MNVSLIVGAVLAIVLGALDAELRQKLGVGVDLGLVLGGLAALGVHAGVSISASSAPKQ